VEIGDRLVPFEASFNCRDIGGYETVDGRRVRRGCVFRSDTLHRLTAADLERARELGIRTVIDLRSTDELTEWGRFAHADSVAFHHLPLFEQEEPGLEPFDHDDPEPPVGEMYVQMATAGRDALATSLRVIAEGEHSVVFHCAAGKDRTGILAALLLSTLGVSEDLVVADYEISEHALAPSFAWACRRDVLAAAFDDRPLSADGVLGVRYDLFDAVSNTMGLILARIAPPDYAKYLQRNEDYAAGLRLMAWLLQHRSDTAGAAGWPHRLQQALPALQQGGNRHFAIDPDGRHVRVDYHAKRPGHEALVLLLGP